ncbi:tRNA pseudouridine(55) synthase TruB [Hydrogenophilus islandicus]
MAQRAEAVDGILLVNKPSGPSSNAVLQTLRRHLHAAKAGHGGTLDPMASGLLVIALGEATKFVQQGLDAEKSYTFRVAFGVATDTGDAQGRVVQSAPSAVTDAALRAVLPRFRGVIQQVPPMVSALKRDGQPLYALARQGVTVERTPRPVTIHRLELVAFDAAAQKALLSATVSKGTYIRALAEAIGDALGVPAHVDLLHRDAVGRFSCADARTLAEWLALDRDAARRALLPVDLLVADLPALVLTPQQADRFCHGEPVPCAKGEQEEVSPLVRVYREENGFTFLGVGHWQSASGVLSPKRLVAKLLNPSPTLPEAIGKRESVV